MRKLLKVDELTRKDHCYLETGDVCYYFKEYTGGRVGYTHNDFNKLILNLKKDPSKKTAPEWSYKLEAIGIIATWLAELFAKIKRIQNITIVPIPPSKTREHPEYDDRLVSILQKVEEKTKLRLDIQELIINRSDRVPQHKTIARLTPYQLKEEYLKFENKNNHIPQEIILFDDILTNGTHYKAAKDILQGEFPNAKIIGLFIGRRVFCETDVRFKA